MADLETAHTPVRPPTAGGENVSTDSVGFNATGRGPLATEEPFKEEKLSRSSEGSSLRKGIDILGKQDIDPALSQKMYLVNNVSTAADRLNLCRGKSVAETCMTTGY